MGLMFNRKRNQIQAGDALYGPGSKKARAESDEYESQGTLVVDIRWLIPGGVGPVETYPADLFTPTRNF